MKECKILSTRKLPAGCSEGLPPDTRLDETEFIRIQPVPASMIQPEIRKWIFSPKKVTVVFTSRHAVIDFNELFFVKEQWHLPDWQIFCLSGATRNKVQEKLFHAPVVGVANDAAGLANKIIDAGVKEVIFFCGNKRRDELPDQLEKHGIMVRELVVYETELSPVTITDNYNAVLFFSPSAVESFFSVNTLPNTTACFAIGETTAARIRELCSNQVIIPALPGKEGMLTAIIHHMSKMNTNNDVEK